MLLDRECVGDTLGDALRHSEAVPHAEIDEEMEGEVLGHSVGETLGDPETLSDVVLLMLPLRVKVSELVKEKDCVGLCVIDALGVELGQRLTVPLAHCVRDTVGEAEEEREPL